MPGREILQQVLVVDVAPGTHPEIQAYGVVTPAGEPCLQDRLDRSEARAAGDEQYRRGVTVAKVGHSERARHLHAFAGLQALCDESRGAAARNMADLECKL